MTKHVVLVEDETNIAEAIRFLLSRDGWRVETLANGGSAAEVIRAAKPDLLILDVMLPGKTGFEIMAELRSDDTLAEMPVLMLTARGQHQHRHLRQRIIAAQLCHDLETGFAGQHDIQYQQIRFGRADHLRSTSPVG